MGGIFRHIFTRRHALIAPTSSLGWSCTDSAGELWLNLGFSLSEGKWPRRGNFWGAFFIYCSGITTGGGPRRRICVDHEWWLRGGHTHLSALERICGLADCAKGWTLELRNFLFFLIFLPWPANQSYVLYYFNQLFKKFWFFGHRDGRKIFFWFKTN